MKILMLAPYVYNEAVEDCRKNKSGFGVMVDDIARSVQECEQEVYVLTNSFTKGDASAYTIVRHSLFDFICALRIKGITKWVKLFKENNVPVTKQLRYLYYYLHTGYIKKVLSEIKPDIVHIHGLAIETLFYVELLQNTNIPYTITAHGLLQHDSFATDFDRWCEKRIFLLAEEMQLPITVISTGIKNRLVSKYYGLQSVDNVTVISNGTNVIQKPYVNDYRMKFDIPQKMKVILCVGSVMERKNQIQILRAYALMPEDERENVMIIFAGTIAEGYPIKETIESLGIEKNVRLLGFVDRNKLKEYYCCADIIILASRDEGFGLSLIEGFSFGIPCVTFSDLDAVQDIMNEDAVLLCASRDDKDFSDVISAAIKKKWDKEKITEYAKQFSLETMAERYCKFYEMKVLK